MAGRLAVDPLLQVPSIQSIKFTTWQDIAPVLEQHLSNRQPVIIRQVLDSSKLSESDLLRGLGDEDITVRVISSPFTDDREHNLAPVFTNKSSEGRHWLDVVPIEELFSDISSSKPWKSQYNLRSPDPKNLQKMAEEHLYWRMDVSSSPGHEEGQALPYILSIANQMKTPFDMGLISNFSSPKRTVLTRAATSGLYYPAHIDCAPNLLYSLGGHRRIMLVDMKEMISEMPSNFSDIIGVKAVTPDALSKFGKGGASLARAELHRGDVLMIPTLWLHDVKYVVGGGGFNTFYHVQTEEIRLCESIKRGEISSMNQHQILAAVRKSEM